jgi:hypothetical protein
MESYHLSSGYRRGHVSFYRYMGSAGKRFRVIAQSLGALGRSIREFTNLQARRIARLARKSGNALYLSTFDPFRCFVVSFSRFDIRA